MGTSHPCSYRFRPCIVTETRIVIGSLRALLVLFISHALDYSDDDAVAIYSYFTSFAYFAPLIGGYLSDSYLGKYKVKASRWFGVQIGSRDVVVLGVGTCFV